MRPTGLFFIPCTLCVLVLECPQRFRANGHKVSEGVSSGCKTEQDSVRLEAITIVFSVVAASAGASTLTHTRLGRSRSRDARLNNVPVDLGESVFTGSEVVIPVADSQSKKRDQTIEDLGRSEWRCAEPKSQKRQLAILWRLDATTPARRP